MQKHYGYNKTFFKFIKKVIFKHGNQNIIKMTMLSQFVMNLIYSFSVTLIKISKSFHGT